MFSFVVLWLRFLIVILVKQVFVKWCYYLLKTLLSMSKMFSVAPNFTNITGDVHIHANDVNVVMLTCRTDSSSPAATIAWYRNNQRVHNKATLSQNVGQNGGLVTSQCWNLSQHVRWTVRWSSVGLNIHFIKKHAFTLQLP